MQINTFTDLASYLLQNPIIRASLIVLSAMAAQLIAGFIITLLVRQLVGYSYSAKGVGRRYKSKTDEQKRENTLISLFRTAANLLIWLTAVIAVLVAIKFNFAILLTSAGVFGVIIGFGAQNVIRDILAGIFIIAENQYRVGDVATLVVAGREVTGQVEDVTIRITRLRDMDGRIHIVRNGSADVVVNYTFDYANVNIDIDVAYESDIDTVEKVINAVGAAMSQDETWAKQIVEPIRFLRVDEFEGTTVRVKALGKVKPSKQWDIAGEFRRRLKKEFEKNDIAMGPQVI